MIIRNQIICFIFLCLYSLPKALCQDYKILCKNALLENVKGKKYSYINDSSLLDVTNLGSIITTRHKKFKIVSIKYVWGKNKHTSGFLWIYDGNNKYIGRYILGDATDLPIKLKRNTLIFSNRNKGCRTTTFKKVSFAFGIPQKIFIPACEHFGDIYEFIE